MPPSATTSCPVTQPASSEARNATAGAMSAATPRRGMHWSICTNSKASACGLASTPSVSVSPGTVRAQLGAQRDQLGEVGDRDHVLALRHADEAVCVEIVAEQERGLAVVRREESRPSIVEEEALVDRLQAKRVAPFRERREDGRPLGIRSPGGAPER